MTISIAKHSANSRRRSPKSGHNTSLLIGSRTYCPRRSVKTRSFQEKFNIYSGEKLHWLQVIKRLLSTVIHAVLPWVVLSGGYGFSVSLLYQARILPHLFNDSKALQSVVLSLNIVLSLLLVFRTNTAHERFWEGRKLWGSLVNTTRNLTRNIWIYIEQREPCDRTNKEVVVQMVAAFAVATKLHLRRETMNSELEPLMSPMQYQKLQGVNHAPLEISYWISDYLQHQYERQRLNVFQLTTLHESINLLVDILGGCERILKTPVPLIYTITLKAILWIYCLLLPFQLVGGITWWTGPIQAFVTFLFLCVNEVGAEIEEPFGRDPNDLPLDAITNTIIRNLEDLTLNSPSSLQVRPNTGKIIDLPRKVA